MENIPIGSDHKGLKLKKNIISWLQKNHFKAMDMGTFSEERCHYPEYAAKVAKFVSSKKAKRGILICYTGIGMSIAANKIPGIRAALCYNAKAAKMTRRHNDSNILVLGSAFCKKDLAENICKIWLKTKFDGGRHCIRIKQIADLDKSR